MQNKTGAKQILILLLPPFLRLAGMRLAIW